MSVSFSAVLGVWGRPTLKDMLDSLKRNVDPEDQVVVVVDSHEQGHRQDVFDLTASYGPQFECFEYDAGYHFLGIEQMNFGFSMQLRGTHVIGLADDDVMVDGAFDTYRKVCEAHPDRPVQPRFVAPWHTEVLWDLPRMQIARVTGALIVPKQYMKPYPSMKDCCVDFFWMQEVLADSPPPVWLDFVSIIAKPPSRNGEVVHKGVWQCDRCKRFGYVEDVDDMICPACDSPIWTEGRIVEAA